MAASNYLHQFCDFLFLICYNPFPVGTPRPGDVPWRSPKGPNLQYLQCISKGLIGNQQKIDNLIKKSVL